MKYFLDTEFIEKPCTIDLISIGIVAEDGREFYGENTDVDWEQASPWVIDNVFPHTVTWGHWEPAPSADGHAMITHHGTKNFLAGQILSFIDDKTKPEFWGYYADYDWVVFCWLFGTMMDLPNGWPKYCRDIKQWADTLGNPVLPENNEDHNALTDARWTREAYNFLDNWGGVEHEAG